MTAVTPRPVLLFRVDASVEIGTGHVMRCIALANAWIAASGAVRFLCASVTPATEARMRAIGSVSMLNVQRGTEADASATTAAYADSHASWIVADGYCFGSEWQRQVKARSARVLVFDDYVHADRYFCDVLLNQNLHATPELYPLVESYTQLLLGTRYALLRPEFSEWRPWERTVRTEANRILVTLGGSDPANVTEMVLSALGQVGGCELHVVIGGSNPHRAALNRLVAENSSLVHLTVDATNMGELMAWADVAVSAAGTTSWELAFMGLPSVIVSLVRNQDEIAAALASAGVAINLGRFGESTSDRLKDAVRGVLGDVDGRRRMSREGRKLVDGRGAERVVRVLSADSPIEKGAR